MSTKLYDVFGKIQAHVYLGKVRASTMSDAKQRAKADSPRAVPLCKECRDRHPQLNVVEVQVEEEDG